MKAFSYCWTWLNHAALNAGASLSCLYRMVKPPQGSHSPEALKYLSESNPLREFRSGLRGD